MDYEIMMSGNIKIGQKMPEFEAITSMGKICSNDYRGKWLVFFSHPGDFTPVCTTEMLAFANSYTYFKNLNTCLLGLSIDSNPSHMAWIYDMYCRTGIRLPFPIVADRSGEIARKYGMISNDISSTETVRNVFIIDDKGIIRTILVYPLNIGRCIPEILRIIEALQTSDCSNGSTPANWCPGNPVIVPSPQTYCALAERVNYINENNNGLSWYLSFKEPSCMPSADNTCKKLDECPNCDNNKKSN